jgi:riboflavin kinase/FMN adenylyltransferase
LTTASEKLGLLESRGVELVLVAPFDAALAALPPSDFFQRFLGEGLCAQSIHVGFNFRFGKGRAGDTGTLASLADPHQIRLQVVPAVERDGVKVSSSSIRQALRDGEVTRAASWLGRPYSLSGQVAQGDRRGHQLGFPTANLRYAHDKLLPKNGVYVTEAIWQKQRFTSVTNIGVRPTFAGAATPGRLVEVHVLDFHSRLYDEFIEIEFHQRLRDERKFDSIDDLKAQIGRDCEQARAWGAGRA